MQKFPCLCCIWESLDSLLLSASLKQNLRVRLLSIEIATLLQFSRCCGTWHGNLIRSIVEHLHSRCSKSVIQRSTIVVLIPRHSTPLHLSLMTPGHRRFPAGWVFGFPCKNASPDKAFQDHSIFFCLFPSENENLAAPPLYSFGICTYAIVFFPSFPPSRAVFEFQY